MLNTYIAWYLTKHEPGTYQRFQQLWKLNFQTNLKLTLLEMFALNPYKNLLDYNIITIFVQNKVDYIFGINSGFILLRVVSEIAF